MTSAAVRISEAMVAAGIANKEQAYLFVEKLRELEDEAMANYMRENAERPWWKRWWRLA